MGDFWTILGVALLYIVLALLTIVPWAIGLAEMWGSVFG